MKRVYGAIAGLLIGIASTMSLGAAAPQHAVDIPALPLQQALNEFARQTGLQLVVRDQDVDKSLRSSELKGTFTVTEGLEKLLANSGLQFGFLNDRTVAVRSAKVDSRQTAAENQMGLRLANDQSDSMQQVQPVGRQQEQQDRETQPEFNEIVVTAQKRTERLQDVPISISVLDGKKLDQARIEGVAEALRRTPGVTMTGVGSNNPTIAVRGVGASGAFYNGATTTAYYVDSVPFGFVKSAFVPDANAYDLERVEVLRGPQGTLYGANSVNGVVRVLTRDADLDDFDFKMRTSISNIHDGATSYRGDTAFNVPIVAGKLAARAVVGYENRGGWIDTLTEKDANDAQLRNYRLRVKAQPSENFTVGASAWISRKDYGNGNGSDDHYRYPNPYLTDESNFSDFNAYGLTLDYTFPLFSVASKTGYIDYKSFSAIDLSIGRLASDFRSEVMSEELLFNSTTEGAWSWSAGGFYRDVEDLAFQAGSNGWPIPWPTNFTDTSESVAIFGEVARKFFGNRLEMTGGLRYFEDKVRQIENTPADGNPTRPLQRSTDTFSAWTPRAVATWQPNATTTIYGSYSQGFRSGFNQSAYVFISFPDFPPIEPDKLTNYEVGIKGELLDGAVSYEAALYYMDWKDIQQTLAVEYLDEGFVFASVNGQSASGLGLDFSLVTQPADRLNLGVNFSVNDLTLDGPIFTGGTLLYQDGERLNSSPKYTVGTFADYSFPLGGSGLRGRISASANYIAKNEGRVLFGTELRHYDGDNLLLARSDLTISWPDHWEVSLFVENAMNENARITSSADPIRQELLPPRTVGLQLEYHFF